MEWEHEAEIKNETEMYDFEVVQSPLDIKFEIDDYMICSTEITIEDEFDQKLSKELMESIQTKNKTYYCEYCTERFENSDQHLQHNLTHLQIYLTRLYECDNCGTCHTNKSALKDHIQSRHRPQKYPCDICKKSFNSYKYWNEHINKVHSSKRFICNICNKVFKCKKYFKRHNDCIHGIKYSYKKDTINNSKEFTYKCLKCSKAFYRKLSLTCHLKNVHSNRVTCEICGSKMASLNYLRVHKQRVHYDDGKDYPCDLCKKIFKSPRYLRVHKTNSHKNKVLEHCSICDSKFKSKELLHKHFNYIHLLQYFKCNECANQFVSDEELQNHRKIFHGKILKTKYEIKDFISDIEIKVEVMD